MSRPADRPVILDARGRPLRPAAFGGYAYEGARRNTQSTRGWNIPLMAAPGETEHSRQPVSVRARDLVRNSGKAAGARRSLVERVVGDGLRFRSRPDGDALGVDPQTALAFGRQIEREIRRWGSGPFPQCDVGREMSFGQIQRLLFSERKVQGENLAVMRWRPDRPGVRYATCLQVVDAERLGNEFDGPDNATLHLRQGIEFSADGEPLVYHIRDAHPADYVVAAETMSWTKLPRMDETGRPVVIHGFDAERAEQVRGMSAFASILLAFKDVQRFGQAELGAAVINAIFAGFIKSNFDPAAVAELLGMETGDGASSMSIWQSARDTIYGETGVQIGDNRVAMLAPGDEFQTNNTTRETGGFADFEKAVERGIAAGLGMDYPTFANNLEGVNYSSLRYGLIDAWRSVTGDRGEFVADTLTPILFCVVQEAFERGYLQEPDGFPSFEDEPAAYLVGNWIGPGRGTVDPVKESQGNSMDVDAGFTSRTRVAEERGQDFEEVLNERVIEEQMMAARGLKPSRASDMAGAMQGDLFAPPEDEKRDR